MSEDEQETGLAERPQLTPAQIAGIARRAACFKASPSVDAALREYLSEDGLTEDDWALIVQSPELATVMKRASVEKFQAVLPIVYDKLFAAAVKDGKGWAFKLLLQRFDPEYVERKENRRTGEEGAFSFDDIDHAMRLRFGDDWDAARAFAKEKGIRGGVIGENYLPGGEAEFGEAEAIDAEVVDVSADDEGGDEPHIFD